MRIIVAVTGASGVEMSYRLLKALRSAGPIGDNAVVSNKNASIASSANVNANAYANNASTAYKESAVEIHLILSRGARLTWGYECDFPIEDLIGLADFVYEEDDLAARISSGSFVTDGMIVMPCSMKTLAGIVTGYAENLINRAADVCLKEGRKVVLVPREMPLSRIHLRNMHEAADLGMAIVPPMLTFYNGERTMEGQIDHVVGKVLMQFGLTFDNFKPWNGPEE